MLHTCMSYVSNMFIVASCLELIRAFLLPWRWSPSHIIWFIRPTYIAGFLTWHTILFLHKPLLSPHILDYSCLYAFVHVVSNSCKILLMFVPLSLTRFISAYPSGFSWNVNCWAQKYMFKNACWLNTWIVWGHHLRSKEIQKCQNMGPVFKNVMK